MTERLLRGRARGPPRPSRRRPPRSARPPRPIASATARVPAANAGNSNTPTGPFQNTVLASASFSANRARVCGPASTPSRSAGKSVTGTTECSASGAKCVAATRLTGSTSSTPRRFGLFHDGLDRGDLVGLEHRVTHLVALGGQERVAHAAADEDAVRQVQQVADHGELVRRLLAAEHHHERARRVGGQLAQHRHLVPDQVAGGVREQSGQVVDRGVLAVHGAERVVHVQLAEAGQPLARRRRARRRPCSSPRARSARSPAPRRPRRPG